MIINNKNKNIIQRKQEDYEFLKDEQNSKQINDL